MGGRGRMVGGGGGGGGGGGEGCEDSTINVRTDRVGGACVLRLARPVCTFVVAAV